MPCEVCGLDAPTQHIKFEQNIGMFFARRSLILERNMCRLCVKRYFRSYTLTTLFLGWWGFLSLIITPIFLINNIREYWAARKLPDPGIAAMNVPGFIQASPVADRSFAFKLIYGVIVWTGVLAIIAYHQVDFLEQHAPALNARMHSGEITDDSDGEYAGLQIGKDIAGLDADLKGTTWASKRTELLARQPYLIDLNEQNEKLQNQMARERDANVAVNDKCEQLAINEFAPALNSYTLNENKLFGFVKGAIKINKENSQIFKEVSDQEDNAIQQLQKSYADFDANKCGK